MNLKKFLHDHLPFLPHGSWKQAAEAIGKKPQNFNEKTGWPHMEDKVKEFEKVLEAWGYKIDIWINVSNKPKNKQKILFTVKNEKAVYSGIWYDSEEYILDASHPGDIDEDFKKDMIELWSPYPELIEK